MNGDAFHNQRKVKDMEASDKEIEYCPTLDNIKLTPEQEALMVQAIRHIKRAPSALKQTTRCQFWFRQIWDLAYRKGADDAKGGLRDEAEA